MDNRPSWSTPVVEISRQAWDCTTENEKRTSRANSVSAAERFATNFQVNPTKMSKVRASDKYREIEPGKSVH